MKKLMVFFAKLNWNPNVNNLLHLLIGVFFGYLIDFVFQLTGKLPEEWYFTFAFEGIIGWALMRWLGEKWERLQMNVFKAKYSTLDIGLGIAGVLLGILMSLFNLLSYIF